MPLLRGFPAFRGDLLAQRRLALPLRQIVVLPPLELDDRYVALTDQIAHGRDLLLGEPGAGLLDGQCLLLLGDLRAEPPDAVAEPAALGVRTRPLLGDLLQHCAALLGERLQHGFVHVAAMVVGPADLHGDQRRPRRYFLAFGDMHPDDEPRAGRRTHGPRPASG